MRVLKTLWALWKLARAMDRSPREVGCSLQIVGEPASSLEDRRILAREKGEPIPDRQTAWQVSYWGDVSKPCFTKTAAELHDALEAALAARQPAMSELRAG